ncbi:hypothetical protein TNCV_3923801 [Trichonephila clavipes]|nr:hypothetical protein TNCV_3923801 [Trichonephila clavipes]
MTFVQALKRIMDDILAFLHTVTYVTFTMVTPLLRVAVEKVKVMNSWLACHEFEPSTTENPPCWEAMHVKTVESSNVLLLVRWKLGERGEPSQMSSSSLDHGSKLRSPSPKALV